jgi:hypothetical protein
MKKNKKIIHITKKGTKGSWWNKFIDNYFIAVSSNGGFSVEYLTNIYGNNCGNAGAGQFISEEFCRVFMTV